VLAVTLKSIRGHGTRLIGTAVAVILGVGFLAGTLVFTDTVGRTFDDLFAGIYENIDVEVRSATAIDTGFGDLRGRIPQDLVEEVAAVEGVDLVEGFVEGTAQIVGRDGEPVGQPGQGPPALGLSWSGDTVLNPWVVVDGRAPAGGDEVAIDRASAGTADVGVGDQVQILTGQDPRPFTVAGIVRFGTIDSPGGATVALFDLATAQDLFDAPGQLDTVSARAEAGVSQDELVERVRVALADRPEAEVLSGDEITAETQSEIRDALGFFNTFLTTFAVIALFVGCFVIYNTFAILIAQRTRELALLRALGASRRQVVASVLIEAVAVGVAASIIGVVAGIGLSFLLREGLAAIGIDIPAGGIVLLPRTVIVGLVVGVVVTVASAVLPAIGAARIAPLQAMRDVSVDQSGRSTRRAIIGAAVTAGGAAVLVVGLL
jgi:putative ABC transport system permease protein